MRKMAFSLFGEFDTERYAFTFENFLIVLEEVRRSILREGDKENYIYFCNEYIFLY
jgi:hypothetical protein